MQQGAHTVATAFGDVAITFTGLDHAHVCHAERRLTVEGRHYYVAANLWRDTIPEWDVRSDMPAIVQREGSTRRTPHHIRSAIIDACTDAVRDLLTVHPSAPMLAVAAGIQLEIKRLRLLRNRAWQRWETLGYKLLDAERRSAELEAELEQSPARPTILRAVG